MKSSYTVREAAELVKRSESKVRRLIDDGQLELVAGEGTRHITRASLHTYLRARVAELLVGMNEVGGTHVTLDGSDHTESKIQDLESENERLRNSLLVQRQNYAALSDDLAAYTAPKIPNH